MKNLKKEIINLYFWKFIWLLVGGVATLVLLNAIFIPGNRRGIVFPIDSILFCVISIVFFLGVVLLNSVMNSDDTKRKTIICIFLFAQLFLQLYLSFKLQGAQGIDDFDMRLQISNLVSGNKSWSSYFKFGPNAGAAILFSKIVMVLGGNAHASLIYNIVNFCSIDIAAIAGYSIANSFKDKSIKNIYFLLVNLFAPLWVTALFVYTDIGALMFGMLCIAFLNKALQTADRKKYFLFLIAASIFASLAYFNKTNAIILSIAIVIYLIFNLLKKGRRQILTISIFIIFFGLSSMCLTKIKQVENAPNNTSFPYSYWVAVGYNESTDGTVYKNGIDTYTDTARFKTKKQKDRYDRNLVYNTFKSSNVKSILKFYFKKINVQWSMGTIGIEHREFTILKNNNRIYDYIFGQKRIFLYIWAQSLYIIIILGILIKAIHVIVIEKSFEKTHILNLMALYFLGIFLFHTLLWEVQERYAYIVIIPMILIGTVGLSQIYNYILEKKITKKDINVLIIISCIATVVGWGLSYKKEYISENNTKVVMGQNFVRKSEYILKPHEELIEHILITNNFNSWYVDSVWADNIKVTVNGKIISPTTHVLNMNGKPGNYKVVVKNTGKDPKTIYLQNNPFIDLFQKPIQNHKNYYIGMSVILAEKPFTIKNNIKWVFLFVLEALLLFERQLYIDAFIRNRQVG